MEPCNGRKTGRSEARSGSCRILDRSQIWPLDGHLTRKMRTSRHRQNRRKDVVFAKNLLPDFVTMCCASATYINLIISFLRRFSHFLRNIHICIIHAKNKQYKPNTEDSKCKITLPYPGTELLRVVLHQQIAEKHSQHKKLYPDRT